MFHPYAMITGVFDDDLEVDNADIDLLAESDLR